MLALAVLGPRRSSTRWPRRDGCRRIRQRGALVCGVAPGVAGFARVDERGRYSGLDVDVCRAVSAAIFGTPDKVRYELASSVDQLQAAPTSTSSRAG